MKLTQEQFDSLINLADAKQKVYPGFRIGQALMNALHEISTQIYAEIVDTEYDCFYDSSLIFKFFTRISPNNGIRVNRK